MEFDKGPRKAIEATFYRGIEPLFVELWRERAAIQFANRKGKPCMKSPAVSKSSGSPCVKLTDYQGPPALSLVYFTWESRPFFVELPIGGVTMREPPGDSMDDIPGI